MINKRKNSGSILTSILEEFLISISIVAMIVAIFVAFITMSVLLRNHRYSETIKENFGISDVFGLSLEEKRMLSPMVGRQIVGIKTRLNEARKSHDILLLRLDITPKNTDAAVNKLRAANALVKSSQEKLVSVCTAVKSRGLIPNDFEGCK